MKSDTDNAREMLFNLLDRGTTEFTAAIQNMVRALLSPTGRPAEVKKATKVLGYTITATKRLGGLIGARSVLLALDRRARMYHAEGEAMKYAACRRSLSYAFDDEAVSIRAVTTPIVPEVPFEEAIADIVTREPRLEAGYRAVQRLYSEAHGFALAKSVQQTVTQQVQDYIKHALKQGADHETAAQIIANMGGWSRGYGATVYRTNLATAFANGQMEQASDPETEDFIVGLRRESVGDSDTRPNHQAADGLVARPSDPIWLNLGLPAGYNCRCSFEMIDAEEARRENIVVPIRATPPPGAFNDPGFTRKSFSTYGV